MKKSLFKSLLATTLIIMLVLAMCACGNENWGPGNYDWKHVHFSDATEGHCATITSWHDNTTGIEIHTEECGSMFLSEGSYILFENESDCPFCQEG